MLRPGHAASFLLALFGLLPPAIAGPAPLPERITFQGRLTSASGNPVDGDVAMTFSIYAADTGGGAIWFEGHSVHVVGGLYSVQLGTTTPLPDSLFPNLTTDRWLGVKVETETQEMTPRYALTSAVYARRASAATTADTALTANTATSATTAGNADTLDGLHALDFSLSTHNHDLAYWKLGGNTVAADANLGTLNGHALDLIVSNVRAMRFEKSAANDGVNIIGGFGGNNVKAGVEFATIAGGGQDSSVNAITDHAGTIGGGVGNTAGDNDDTLDSAYGAAVGGGGGNTASSTGAAVMGGLLNTANGIYTYVGGGFANTSGGNAAVVGGGSYNAASGGCAVVGGGYYNSASGNSATVGGGSNNTAAGDFSFAIGENARIGAAHGGTFLFSDHTGLEFNSEASNEFASRATGGVRFVTAIDVGTGAPARTFSIAGTGDVTVQGTVTATGFSGPLTGTASNSDRVDNLHAASFLRSDAGSSLTSGTLTLNAGTTLSIMGALSLPVSGIAGAGSGSGLNADLLDGFHVANLDVRYVRVAGSTMLGALTLAGDPLNALEAATKRYVDTGLATKADTAYVDAGLAGKANVSPNADLSNLVVPGLKLSPAFSPAIGFYSAKWFVRPASVQVTPTASDPAATIAVNGEAVTSGTSSSWIIVRSGITQISVVVTATDGVTRKGYMILVFQGEFLQTYVKASNTGAGDNFGYSVAVSGDTVVVGAYYESSAATGVNGDQTNNSASQSGAAYVFVRNGGVWTQQAYLKASNSGAGDWFGYSVAVSGDTVVVGAPQEDSNATGVNGNQADNSAMDSGAAYVFVRSGGVWTQQAYLKASNTGASDIFGSSVAVSGDTVVVGAYWENSNATGVDGNQADNSALDSGAAYMFVRSGGVWTQQAYLKASNTGGSDSFGISVAVSGDTVVVGAGGENSNATGVNGNQADNSAQYSGAAYVFMRSGGVWTQQAYLKASNTGANDHFGSSVAVSGDTVVVGAPSEDSNATGVNGNQADNSAANSGAAYVFVRSGGVWTQQAYLKASNTEAGDNFGSGVAVSGDTVVVEASGEDSNATGVNGNQADNSASGSGAAYVFVRSGGVWTQQAYLKASNTGANDWFGSSVAVSGDTVVVGTPYEDSNATGVNGNQGDNSATDSGAFYIFE